MNDAISRRSTGKATTRTRRTTKKHGKTIYPTEPPDHHTQIHKSRIPYPEYMSLKILHHRHIRQGVPLHRKKSDSRRIYANPHTDRNLKRTVNKALEAVDLILRTSNNGVFFEKTLINTRITIVRITNRHIINIFLKMAIIFRNSGKLSLVPYTKDFGRITHF